MPERDRSRLPIGATTFFTSFLLTLLIPGIGGAVGVTLTPVGGSATGFVGQVLTIGVDLTIGDDEFVTIADPSLVWDLEGGNVLDVVGATQPGTIFAGDIPLSPLSASTWRVFDPDDQLGDGMSFSNDGPFGDTRVGATGLWGFEMTSALITDDQLIEFFGDGTIQPGTYRIGTLDLLLRSIGSTTLTFGGPAGQDAPYGTFFTGREIVRIGQDELELVDLDVTGIGLASLGITVVPEPGTALLLGLGLAGLAIAGRRGEAAARDRSRPSTV
ncbi:MAG: PEP-CTERM sorting domain-containing protein [bacterium]|nr:PEP-CTERM sorting domain-containing protein [bacterium]